MSDLRERWQLEGPYGTEIWYAEHGRFTEVIISGRALKLTGGEDDFDRVPARRAPCGHGGAWPHAFAFCPECGTQLAPPLRLPAAEAWSAPFGPPSGLPWIDDLRVPDPQTRRDEILPSPASLSFVVAGTPPRLFAIDLHTGWLHEMIGGGQWSRLQRLRLRPGTPRAEFSVAALPGGFLLPGEAGPIWVAAGAAAPAKPAPAPPEWGVTVACGGAAAWRDDVIMPVSGKNGFSVAIRGADGTWSAAAVTGGAPGADAWLAAPVTHGGDAIWCGATGMLHVRADGPREISAVWRSWRPGLQPLLDVRPVIAPDGTLHQLARNAADELVWEYLAPPGAAAMRRPTDGLWLSVGQAAFREGKVRRLPWDGVTKLEFPLEDGAFLLPLLAFTAQHHVLAVCQDRDSLHTFITGETPETAGGTAEFVKPRRCALQFSLATRRLQPLGRTFQATRANDLVSFVFRDRLYVYAAGGNECASWALLEEMPS